MLAQYQAVQEAQIAQILIHSKALFRKKKDWGLLLSHFQFMKASAFEEFCLFVSYVGNVRRKSFVNLMDVKSNFNGVIFTK